jgi:hypothetical protein
MMQNIGVQSRDWNEMDIFFATIYSIFTPYHGLIWKKHNRNHR